MAKILIIDDEPLYQKMISRALEPLGYEFETADDGVRGINAANAAPPDLIIVDVMMPKLDGYQVIQRLRRDTRFAHTPILILTAQAELEDKLKAFEVGADEHMSKPFEQAELVARAKILVGRSELVKKLQPMEEVVPAHIVATHSLRGGIGCSSVAINLAVGMTSLWEKPTLLIDLVLNAGQAALMLNESQKRTWTDLARFSSNGNSNLDIEAMHSIIGEHKCGLRYIAAPTYPEEADLITGALFSEAFNLLRPNFEYIVADLPHMFDDISLQVLDAADYIVLILSPEIAAVRAADAALDTYAKLGYDSDRIKLVLNSTFPRGGLARQHIEGALHRPIDLQIPYAVDRFLESINYGQPLLLKKPDDPVAILFEEFAFHLSREEHKKHVPESPSEAWARMKKRHIR